MRYIIQYRVVNFDGLKEAGPYESSELESQCADISSFEGVYDVRAYPFTEEAGQ